MLATESMLNALEEVEVEEVYTNNNDDHDFGKVLEFCCDLEQP